MVNHSVFKKNQITKTIGVHDTLSALVAEKYDFDALWVSGLGLSTVRGVPDASFITYKDILSVSTSIVENTNIPVVVDCDNGFGNYNNIEHIVKEFERVGVSGICIEDKPFPKKNSFLNQSDSEDPYEFAVKINMAKKAKKNSSFSIIARIESLILGLGLEDAIQRANLYAKAGADAILIHSKSSDYTEIVEFTDTFRKYNADIPIVIVPTTYPKISQDLCIEKNINGIIYANQLLRGYLKSLESICQNIKNNKGTHDLENKISSVSEVFDITKTNKLRDNDIWAEKTYNNFIEKIKT